MTQARDTQLRQGMLDEAIAWHVALQGEEATGEDWEGFTQWLSADPDHNIAYQEIDSLWDELDAAKDEIRPHLSMADAAAWAITAEWPNPFRGISAHRMGYALAAIAASLVLFVGIWTTWLSGPESEHYATHFGERQDVVLADGSHIYLNANTQISVELNTVERRIVLERGQALFDVAKDPARPFWVAAGSQHVRVVGTMFDILKGADSVTVTVARGIVDVMPAAAAVPGALKEQRQVARLTAGQQLVHQTGMPLPEISTINPERVIAWRDGHLIYDDTPLSQVAADLNRYYSIRIEPQNDKVGALRFSGVLQLDTEEKVIQRLETLLPIKIKRVDDVISMRLNAP